MYTFKSRIRHSEGDRYGRLGLKNMIDYFQDCAVFQSEDLGIGVEYLHAFNLAWVLSTWNIEIKRLPRLGENIITGTAPYDVKGFFGKRNFLMTTDDGEELIVADSLWTMLNLKEGRPARVPDEVIDRYELFEKLPMEYIRSRIDIPDDMKECEPVKVREHYIDSNVHVNNSRYMEIAADCVNLKDIERLRVEYHKQAMTGDVLIPRVGANESGTVIVIENNDGEKSCVIQMEER